MKKIKWCVNYEWEYDLDWLVMETKAVINEILEKKYRSMDNLKDIEDVARNVVHHAIAPEDDDLYYAFGDAQYETIIYEILQELKK